MQTPLSIFDDHAAQCEKILELLQSCSFVPTKALMQLGIYQYNARIFELRHLGYNIVSKRYNGIYGFTLSLDIYRFPMEHMETPNHAIL